MAPTLCQVEALISWKSLNGRVRIVISVALQPAVLLVLCRLLSMKFRNDRQRILGCTKKWKSSQWVNIRLAWRPECFYFLPSIGAVWSKEQEMIGMDRSATIGLEWVKKLGTSRVLNTDFKETSRVKCQLYRDYESTLWNSGKASFKETLLLK